MFSNDRLSDSDTISILNTARDTTIDPHIFLTFQLMRSGRTAKC